MEPITLTVKAIATLIFSKALEKGGEKLGEAISDKIGQLLNLIREKFQQEGVEGKLTKAQKEPNEKNKSRFERELAEQMEDDEAFAKQLKELVEQIKINAKDEKIQSILSDIEAESIKAEGIKLEATGSGATKQEVLKNIEAESIKAEGIELEATVSGATKQETLKKIKGQTIEASNLSLKTSSGDSEKKSH